MKASTFLLALSLALAPLLDAQEAALEPGQAVTPEALTAAKWIQGAAPEAWEQGEVYVIECWATWCGPCIAAIPHLNELHRKFADQGLRVMGISVWEDDEQKVRQFVENKGDGMSYPVAFAGREGRFVKEWLEPAGVRGIPHTFVVKDGTLLFTTHPSELTEEVVGKVLAGGKEAQEAIVALNEQKVTQEKMRPLLQAMQQASAKGDTTAMKDVIAKIEELDPDAPHLPMLRLELDLANKDWDAAARNLATMEGPQGIRSLGAFSYRVLREPSNFPDDFQKDLAATFDRLVTQESEPDSYACIMLASLKLKLGDREGAVAAAKKGAETAGDQIPSEPLDRFAGELEAGKSPGAEEVLRWVREALQARAAGQPAPSAPEK